MMGNETSQKEIDAIKDLVCEEVDARSSMLIEASHAIHENPELNFEEHFAVFFNSNLFKLYVHAYVLYIHEYSNGGATDSGTCTNSSRGVTVAS